MYTLYDAWLLNKDVEMKYLEPSQHIAILRPLASIQGFEMSDKAVRVNLISFSAHYRSDSRKKIQGRDEKQDCNDLVIFCEEGNLRHVLHTCFNLFDCIQKIHELKMIQKDCTMRVCDFRIKPSACESHKVKHCFRFRAWNLKFPKVPRFPSSQPTHAPCKCLVHSLDPFFEKRESSFRFLSLSSQQLSISSCYSPSPLLSSSRLSLPTCQDTHKHHQLLKSTDQISMQGNWK